MIKRISVLLVAASLVFLVLAGCGAERTPPNTDENQTPPGQSEEGEGAKIGLAVISNTEKSKSAAGEEPGLAQVDSTVVGVLTDTDGRIIKCVIDSVQSSINFTNTGEITTDITAEIESKLELGEAYGMKGASTIGKEWSDQAQAFAEYVQGKTIDEVKGIALNEEGVATDAELNSSVTISLGGFIRAVERAVENALDSGAETDDGLGLGIVTNIEKSTAAANGEDGLAQSYSNYALVTFDGDGRITSCIIDAAQVDVNFNAAGEVVSDLNEDKKTKQEIADAYGMRGASSIGKEWYEQADAFAQYVVGKTLDEVKGIAISEEGKPTGVDLTGSVTISVADAIRTIEKAYAFAK